MNRNGIPTRNRRDSYSDSRDTLSGTLGSPFHKKNNFGFKCLNFSYRMQNIWDSYNKFGLFKCLNLLMKLNHGRINRQSMIIFSDQNMILF